MKQTITAFVLFTLGFLAGYRIEPKEVKSVVVVEAVPKEKYKLELPTTVRDEEPKEDKDSAWQTASSSSSSSEGDESAEDSQICGTISLQDEGKVLKTKHANWFGFDYLMTRLHEVARDSASSGYRDGWIDAKNGSSYRGE